MSFLKNLLNDAQAVAHLVEGKPNAPAKAAPPSANRDPKQTMIPYADPNQAAQSMQKGQGFIPYSNPAAASATIPQALRQPASNPALLRTLLNAVAPHLTADAGMTSQLQQGGEQNPGYTPLQGSVGIPKPQGGADVYWQNTDGQLRNMINPQVSDTGYYY